MNKKCQNELPPDDGTDNKGQLPRRRGDPVGRPDTYPMGRPHNGNIVAARLGSVRGARLCVVGAWLASPLPERHALLWLPIIGAGGHALS